MTMRRTPADRAADLLDAGRAPDLGLDVRRSLTSPLRRVRQRILLWRRPLSALLAVLAVLAVLRASAEPAEETRAVVVAGADLVAGRPLTTTDLETAELPLSGMPDGVTPEADMTALLGRVLAAPLRRGEPVTDVRLVAPGLLEGYPGLVAVPLRVADPGAVRLLRVGDRIDLVSTAPDDASSTVVASRVPVVALPDGDEEGGLDGGLVGGGLVVVAVPRAEAPDLAGRSISSVLSVVLTG